jgi:hypothetical protein
MISKYRRLEIPPFANSLALQEQEPKSIRSKITDAIKIEDAQKPNIAGPTYRAIKTVAMRVHKPTAI